MSALASAGRWLLLLDLDGTLWDHPDVSALRPPFRRVGRGVIADSGGVVVRLYGYMVDLALWARRRGAIVASLSWNVPYNALEALRAFNVDGVFDYHLIEPHPSKGAVLHRFLRELARCRRIVLPPCRIVYIDDRDIHLTDVKRAVGDVNFILAHRDCRGLGECAGLIEAMLERCGAAGDPAGAGVLLGRVAGPKRWGEGRVDGVAGAR